MAVSPRAPSYLPMSDMVGSSKGGANVIPSPSILTGSESMLLWPHQRREDPLLRGVSGGRGEVIRRKAKEPRVGNRASGGTGPKKDREMSLRDARRRSNLNPGDGRLLRFARNDMTDGSRTFGCGQTPCCGFVESWFHKNECIFGLSWCGLVR